MFTAWTIMHSPPPLPPPLDDFQIVLALEPG